MGVEVPDGVRPPCATCGRPSVVTTIVLRPLPAKSWSWCRDHFEEGRLVIEQRVDEQRLDGL